LEDLDGARVAMTHVDACLRDLEWLGLDWDGAPRIQSAGLERIRDVARDLERRGLAYPCRCTRGDLRADLNAPQQGSSELRYSGRCRQGSAPKFPGEPTALRFQVPEGAVAFVDEVWGPQSVDVNADVGDFVVLRRDGIPSYQLAVTVDDAYDGVTEVVRGCDLLPSTARQLLLASALGYPEKRFYHLPLVVDPSGRRLAKRADDIALATLRERGIDPRKIVGWVARHSGMPEVEQASARELIERFDWKQLPKDPVVVGEGGSAGWGNSPRDEENCPTRVPR
jgi:glutamyl-tRNA synthetase